MYTRRYINALKYKGSWIKWANFFD